MGGIVTEARKVDISVIVPAFNASQSIARTIGSVLDQDIETIELIVIDDGSTDDTFHVTQALVENSRISTRILRQENSGVSVARNEGLREANGRYVFFLDADDFIDEECLSIMYEEAMFWNADIVFCGYDRVTPTGVVLEPYDQYFGYLEGPLSGTQAVVEILKQNFWICTGSGLYRKALLDAYDVRFTIGCTGGEDVEFTLKAVFHSERLVSVPKTMSYYVQRPKESALGSDTVHKRQIDSLAAHYRVMKYFEQRSAEQELMAIVESYVMGWILPGTVASLASGGYPSLPELLPIVEEYSGESQISANDFSWIPSWKCRMKATLGNWLLRFSPTLFCLIARLRKFM